MLLSVWSWWEEELYFEVCMCNKINMSSFMYEIKEGFKTIVPRTWETDVCNTLTFAELFENIFQERADYSVSVEVGHKLPQRDASQFVRVRLSQNIGLLDLQGANFIRFHISPLSSSSSTGGDETPPPKTNAFDMMAGNAKRFILPKPRNLVNNRDKLYNHILLFLKCKNVGFRPGTEDKSGDKFVDTLADIVWQMEHHWDTLQGQSIHKPTVIQLIYDYSDKSLYDDYIFKKQPKPRLSQEKLTKSLDKLCEYLQTTWMNGNSWKEVRKFLSDMVDSLRKYLAYLEKKNKDMKKMHNSLKLVRSPIIDSECFTLEAKTHILPALAEIDGIVDTLPTYQIFLLNDLPSIAELSKQNRYRLFLKLSENGLSSPVVYTKYSPQAGIATYHYIWKIPKDPKDRDDSSYSRLTNEISENIGTYHTRAMKAEYQEHFSSICNLKPAVYRAMYSYLTDDKSASTNKAMDERVNVALENNDKDFVYDLRQHNTGAPEIYTEFWETLSKILNNDLPAATQERRENSTMYMPLFISIRDLINKVLEVKPDVKVPSESWILLQFTPKDKSRHTALNYTSKYDIVYKMQSRSQHKNHPDRYYCMALFKYLRTFAVKHSDFVVFFCEDDKHLVSVGEPDAPIAALDRNRRVMVPKNVELVAMDHDYKRFKICPSVILNNEIPESINETFYHGQVFVSVKDAVFQKSTPLRHAVEKQKCSSNDISEWKQIECNYSDGGPDHNVSYYSVKIAHICHFLKMDLDMFAAAITYPGGSYVDPAERVMPLLNIAMNGVALAREKMTEENEKKTKNCNSMEALRNIAESDPELEKSLKDSVYSCINILEDRFSRVALKDLPIKILKAATDEEELSLFQEMSAVDSTLKITETTKAEIVKHHNFLNWVEAHAIERRYIFQLKKCENSPINERVVMEAAGLVGLVSGLSIESEAILIDAIKKATTCFEVWKLVEAAEQKLSPEEVEIIISNSKRDPCGVCKPPRLPLGTFMNLKFVPDPMPVDGDDSKFKQFEEVYGKQTKETFRPSFVENLDESNKSLLVKEKARFLVNCVTCLKPRVVYGDAKTFKTHKDLVSQHLEVVFYTCGSSLFSEEHSLHSSLVVKMMLTCEDMVEIAYFSSKKFNNVCIYCGSSDNLVPAPEGLQKEFRSIYPLCKLCQGSGKKHFTRMPVLAGKKRKSH